MPNRIIKESIKRSPEIDRLSWFEEVVFYRLIVTADDYGRLDGRMIVLKNDLFPTKDTVTKKAIEDAISKLVSVGLLIPYVDAESGMPYLVFRTWDKHQRIRDSKAKYPAPPDEILSAATRGNLPQIAANCGLESESESESESKGGTRARARFAPPTEDDVAAYAEEMGYAGFNAAAFVAHYQSNGWRVGRNPMKDWRATVRRWHSQDMQQHEDAARRQIHGSMCKERDYTARDQREYFIDPAEFLGGGT